MKRFATALVAILVGLLLSACSTVQIEHSADPGLDLSAAPTWSWAERDESEVSAERHERIAGSIEKELAARGFKRAGEAPPDFKVAYHAYIETKRDSMTTSDRDGARMGYGWRSVPREKSTHLSEYEVGVLVIELLYASSGKLAWSGEAWTELVDADSTPGRLDQVDGSVARILDRLAARR